ncbi:MAG: peptidylprolyl isomerase [Aurantimonas endophytica]|uniref:peptidylprolyl isomerase n=1 Tax=Aurantimonas endophytica TaxID=1522175 RepID=UPI003002B893
MKLFATLGLAAAMTAAAFSGPAAAQASDPENTLVITTASGDITVQLRPDLAPKHVERIKALAGDGFYDGLVFHRVIDGFMAQTGDPTGTGMGGSDMPDLEAEFSDETFDRGTLGMARSQDPNSANSQFFIMLADGDFLDGQYTIVGDVVEGMENVDKIKKGDAAQNGTVEDPDKMVKVRLAGQE